MLIHFFYIIKQIFDSFVMSSYTVHLALEKHLLWSKSLKLTSFCFSKTPFTLFHRALCEYFNLEPRIINGSELLNSYIGKSEKAVRSFLYAPEKIKTKWVINIYDAIISIFYYIHFFFLPIQKGDSSPLHVIVFEEMDALFSKRKLNVSCD
jgi:hypothetical protein